MDDYFFVHKGSGTYQIGNDLVRLEKGDFLWIPAKIRHTLATSILVGKSGQLRTPIPESFGQ